MRSSCVLLVMLEAFGVCVSPGGEGFGFGVGMRNVMLKFWGCGACLA